MKFKKKKVAAVALSALFVCGAFSACDFVTSDSQKDLLQVIAEVDITKSEAFQEGNEFAAYADAIDTAEIVKRDMVASFMSVGYQYINTYGYTYQKTFELIMSSLVNRQIYLQYATTYFLGGDGYSVEAYKKATEDIADDTDKQIAGLKYFLDEDEIKQAEYNVKVTFNATIDAQETNLITVEDDGTEYDTARTTPTGVDTEKEDYYDEAYKIYLGSNSASDCGSYETVDGSTPTTRRKAYGQFLASLNTYALIQKGEDTTDITSLSYYRLELKNAYEDALINKLSEAFEAEAEKQITDGWVKEQFEKTLATQQESFSADPTAVSSALDSVSDSSFVLYSPDQNGNNYGFVINILLPFSTTQTTALENALADYGDKQGNYFGERAKLLQNVKATDQRKTWFTCEADYSFEAAESDNAFTNGNADRTHLFFENNLNKTDRYEPIPNYYGKYTYNGTVTKDADGDYVLTPARISVDGFLDEMEKYLASAGFTTDGSYVSSIGANDEITKAGALDAENGYPAYFTREVSAYYATGEVDYSSFVYYYGQVCKNGATLASAFNANNVFKAGSSENDAMSVINELSFAYNTDTAGLNTYLGYVVSPDETNFVKEFEYAAQLAVKGGVGTYVVSPSDYGWHIMYCTFSYTGAETPYDFNWDEIETEGTFSNLYYEALKSSNLEKYANDRQKRILNAFYTDVCVTTYENRYADLIAAGDGN